MTQDFHQRARELLILGERTEHSTADHAWLESHLETCAGCRQFAREVSEAVGALRSISVMAGSDLVWKTQSRVRLRAEEWRQDRARKQLLWTVSVFVALSSVFAAPLFWFGFQWMGRAAHLSDLAWQSAFCLFWIAPAMAASFVCIVRDMRLTGRENERGL